MASAFLINDGSEQLWRSRPHDAAATGPSPDVAGQPNLKWPKKHQLGHKDELLRPGDRGASFRQVAQAVVLPNSPTLRLTITAGASQLGTTAATGRVAVSGTT